MSMDRVPGHDGLYIGGLLCLRRKQALKDARITHVVSVMREPLSPDLFRDFLHLKIPVHDMNRENMIEHFATSNNFIQSALAQGGAVLVHCVMGKSRSATLVLAYMLSESKKTLTPKLALALLRQSRPMVEPNSGFKAQLTLYHSMGCPDDGLEKEHAYQRWLFQKNNGGVGGDYDTKKSDEHRDRDVVYFDAPGGPLSSTTTATSTQPSTASSSRIRCRRCRQNLAPSASILTHTPKKVVNDQAIARPRPQFTPILESGSAPSQQQQCAHVFVDPLSWMKPTLEEGLLEGKFHCPNSKCKALVGRYAWQGMPCSCGEWVVPAISLSRARVDDLTTTTSTTALPSAMERRGEEGANESRVPLMLVDDDDEGDATQAMGSLDISKEAS